MTRKGSAARRSGVQRSNDLERMLHSGRYDREDPTWLPPEVADRRVDDATREASALLGEAHALLATYRDDDLAPDLQRAYAAVHAARGQLAAARHWRAVSRMLADRQTGRD